MYEKRPYVINSLSENTSKKITNLRGCIFVAFGWKFVGFLPIFVSGPIRSGTLKIQIGYMPALLFPSLQTWA